MTATVVPAGADAPSPQPGDFILTRDLEHWYTRAGFVGGAIRFGQRLRYRGDRRKFAWTNHAAGVVDTDGTLVEMLAGGATVSPLSKYTDREYVYVSSGLDDARRTEAADYWHWLAENRTGYGWWSIVADGLSLLTRLRFGLAVGERPVCSAAVVAGLGLPKWRACPASCMPADLALAFNALPAS